MLAASALLALLAAPLPAFAQDMAGVDSPVLLAAAEALPEVGQTSAIAGKNRMEGAKAPARATTAAPATQTKQGAAPAAPVAQAAAKAGKSESPAAPKAEKAVSKELSPDWAPLIERLRKDGAYGDDVENWFASLDNGFSQKPMGSKVSSVFNYRYRPFKYLRKPVKSPSMLPQVHVQPNIVKCADFLLEHADLFEAAEKTFKVDRGVVVSLLMVETKLGTYMGNEHAFWSLSCMALADKPEKIQSYLDKMYLTKERRNWVNETVTKRSEWAYNELVALINYCRKYGHDALAIHGSPYGAIGLCQFMPSNIEAYAVDGNGDDVIDLFDLEDAIPSIASYISKHGWKPGMDRAQQHKVVRRYNHSDMYANTVLALSDSTKGYLAKNPQGSRTPRPAAGKAAAPAKKAEAANGAAKPGKPAASAKPAVQSGKASTEAGKPAASQQKEARPTAG